MVASLDNAYSSNVAFFLQSGASSSLARACCRHGSNATYRILLAFYTIKLKSPVWLYTVAVYLQQMHANFNSNFAHIFSVRRYVYVILSCLPVYVTIRSYQTKGVAWASIFWTKLPWRKPFFRVHHWRARDSWLCHFVTMPPRDGDGQMDRHADDN